MQQAIASLLRCPLSGTQLTLETVTKFIHPLTKQPEIHSGFLWSSTGGCYPIINGIPRMLPESILFYAEQLRQWWPEFDLHKERITNTYGEAMKASSIQNKKIQSTFGFEWSLLRRSDNLKIWNKNAAQFKDQLAKELQLTVEYHCQLALDAGCGHGRSARLLAMFADNVFGAEVSLAIELAYEQNDRSNCHFIQADVYYLPFESSRFDLVYSSGVLHHNPSTKTAIQHVALLVKPGGIFSLWLYHPFKNALHIFMRSYRTITRHLPVEVVYYLNAFTLTPLQWSISQLRGKRKRWTEIAIEQLDMLTPAYRHEHSDNDVKHWLENFGFHNIVIADHDNYGFSIKSEKNSLQ